MDWPALWFLILGVLLFGYAVLDGFDFGVGMLHNLVSRDDRERRIVLNSIGPLWDGNEVWLVTFGGGLFAAFPNAYASVFSAFYLPFMLLLCALIFRATAIEFRSKVHSQAWRGFWDLAFSAASFGAPFLMGVAVGNLVWGIPIDDRGLYRGGLFDLLQPYALLVGLLAVATFAMHGAIYLYLKTEGELQQRIVPWMWRTFGLFNILYILVTMATLVYRPEVTRHLQAYPLAWGLVLMNVLAVANVPRSIFKERPFQAFLSSTFVILAQVFLFGAAMFPNMVTSTLSESANLTVYEASSSLLTLKLLTVVAALGMPMVLTYTAIVYWTFRGKVKLGEFSY
jgi:cytochrome d ubiquinol oxidase subunit II